MVPSFYTVIAGDFRMTKGIVSKLSEDGLVNVTANAEQGSAYLVYFAGYASICDSSGSRDWYADGRGWGVDGGAEAVS